MKHSTQHSTQRSSYEAVDLVRVGSEIQLDMLIWMLAIYVLLSLSVMLTVYVVHTGRRQSAAQASVLYVGMNEALGDGMQHLPSAHSYPTTSPRRPRVRSVRERSTGGESGLDRDREASSETMITDRPPVTAVS